LHGATPRDGCERRSIQSHQNVQNQIAQRDCANSFHRAQSDYGLSTGLALVNEVAEQVLPEKEVSEAMFRLIRCSDTAHPDSLLRSTRRICQQNWLSRRHCQLLAATS
jgi:hypothetical protein